MASLLLKYVNSASQIFSLENLILMLNDFCMLWIYLAVALLFVSL